MKTRRHGGAGAYLVVGVVLVSSLAGCERLFGKDEVATGVARLTVKNVGTIASLVNSDSRCGFESQAVKDAVQLDGEAGRIGKATWYVDHCLIDLGKDYDFGRGCHGEPGERGSGKVIVTARRVIEGRLTGDVGLPIIPAGPDAVVIDILDATFDKFTIAPASGAPKLVMRDGSISATLKPRLAAERDTGICAIVTSNVTFSNIRYRDATVRVKTEDRDFEVDVDASNITAQNGIGPGGENTLAGVIDVWGTKKKVPNDGDNDGLDPGYHGPSTPDPECVPKNLQLPVSFACNSEPILAQNLGRIAIITVGELAKHSFSDPHCGLSTSYGLDTLTQEGPVGRDGGKITLSIDHCGLSLPAADADIKSGIRGTAIVDARLEATGIITGAQDPPIVPTSRDAAVLTVDAQLADFTLTYNRGWALTFERGRLAGEVVPRLAYDPTVGACSVPTEIATFNNVHIEDAVLVLRYQDMVMRFDVPRADLQAQACEKDGSTNWLTGTAEVDGNTYAVPPEGADPVLDPTYDPATYPVLPANSPAHVPLDDSECSFHPSLAQAAARLVVKTIAGLARLADSDAVCGFQSVAGEVPSDIEGEVDNPGAVSWHVDACRVGSGQPAPLQLLSADTPGFVVGFADVTATKRVEGRIVFGVPPLVPDSEDGVRVSLDATNLSNLDFYELNADGSIGPHLVFHSGELTGTLRPVMKDSPANPGVFDVERGDYLFDDVEVHNAEASLYVDGMQFHFHIDHALLWAAYGSYSDRSNELKGTLTLNGDTIAIPVNPDDPGLLPECGNLGAPPCP